MEELFQKYIIWELALIIILSSYWLKNFFSQVLPIVNLKFKILIWASILSIAYYYILTSEQQSIDWVQFVLTYFAATSFYELAWQPIETLLKKYLKFSN